MINKNPGKDFYDTIQSKKTDEREASKMPLPSLDPVANSIVV